ncbi:helix-turn-helix domain-containing protein [Lysobacter niastensis]|uniref:DNA-binding protein n=1 Tax=Lysobacter niastensis TaxID=380629 RepID=A0ABS0B2V8_9GAMM|nr:helix-turn-helix domain-containing protein [Lysobacter niastensis]MBF6022807.1 DNA-binding protein [Lysobacter niastensis]
MKQASQYLTTAQMADALHRAPETLVRWRRQRIGPPWITLHGRVLYDSAATARWMEQQQVALIREAAAG